MNRSLIEIKGKLKIKLMIVSVIDHSLLYKGKRTMSPSPKRLVLFQLAQFRLILLLLLFLTVSLNFMESKIKG